jgi:FkbM family methyltransferase
MTIPSMVKNAILRKFERKHNPEDISYEDAFKWFEHRKDAYEKLISAAQPYVDSEGTIFDIVANIGYFSFLLLRQIAFRGSVYLFEPVPNLANLCRRTFRGSPYKVKVFDFALGDENGESEIFTARNGNIGWNTFISNKASPEMARIKVKVKRYDSTGIKAKPCFIKVDVEGAEYKVFRGGILKSLKTWKPLPVILCEVGWGGDSHPNWSDERLIFKELEKLGYSFYNLDKSRIDIGNLQQTTDVLMCSECPCPCRKGIHIRGSGGEV